MNEELAKFRQLTEGLENGSIRVARRSDDGTWVVDPSVKEGILAGFRAGRLADMNQGQGPADFSFVEKDSLNTRKFTVEDGVRVVPGGSSVRCGAYVAPGVIIMPPAYVNIGAYVDEGTMVDSHALVGSCAQIGKRVHLSAASQIGGVLEPVGALPVIIEDDVFIGGNCGVYEGTIVRRNAVLGTGVIINSSTAVYDAVNDCWIRPGDSGCLEIPEGAVVVAGSRPLNRPGAVKAGIQVYTPVIIKYRDSKTDSSITLEDTLR